MNEQEWKQFQERWRSYSIQFTIGMTGIGVGLCLILFGLLMEMTH